MTEPIMLTKTDLESAIEVVRPFVPVTPARRWPLIEHDTGVETWIKHEAHNPTGAFKVRGGLIFMAHLAEIGDDRGVISASRGNHSQSLAFAGQAYDRNVTIVVPEGNSADKNAATEAFGADVIIHGADFQAALEYAMDLAAQENLVAVPPLHPWLIEGVATYAFELHEQVPDLDVIYVPVGMGSGICANIAGRDVFGLSTEIVGVVAENAPAYALSFDAGELVATETANTFVDGVACRTPDPLAVATINKGASRIITVSEQAAAEAMTLMYRSTHQLAEPAGALALAAVLDEKDSLQGKKVAFIHTGANVDFNVLDKAFAMAD